MAHDYAKKNKTTNSTKNKKQPAATGNSQKIIPGWLWLFTGIALGAFVMFLIHLANVEVPTVGQEATTTDKTPNINTARAPSKASASKATAPQPPKNSANNKQQAATGKQQKPRFDFYKTLEESEVPVYQTDTGKQATPHQQPKIRILQVASFKAEKDAEQLKVELILLGLDASMQSVTVRNGEVWHRVLVGPFENRSKLAKARSTLLSNGHQALVLAYSPAK